MTEEDKPEEPSEEKETPSKPKRKAEAPKPKKGRGLKIAGVIAGGLAVLVVLGFLISPPVIARESTIPDGSTDPGNLFNPKHCHQRGSSSPPRSNHYLTYD